jgi:hypothetical protein
MQKEEMIQLRPTLPWSAKGEVGAYLLTPEEESRLLVESYEALADHHEPESLRLLLHAIKEGNPKNRYVLAGLLLRAIQ